MMLNARHLQRPPNCDVTYLCESFAELQRSSFDEIRRSEFELDCGEGQASGRGAIFVREAPACSISGAR